MTDYIYEKKDPSDTRLKSAIEAYRSCRNGKLYDQIAARECAKMEAALRAVMVENEQNPVKIKWYC